jgi:hypothetical protein
MLKIVSYIFAFLSISMFLGVFMPKLFNEGNAEPVSRASYFSGFIVCLIIALSCFYFGGGFDTRSGVDIKPEELQSRYNKLMKELDYEEGSIKKINTDKNQFASVLGNKAVIRGTIGDNGLITSIEYMNQGEPGSSIRQVSPIHLGGILTATNQGLSSKERANLVSNLANVNSVDPLLGGTKEVIVKNVKYTIEISAVNGIVLKAENK